MATASDPAKRVLWPGALLAVGGALQIASYLALEVWFAETVEGLEKLSPAGRAGGAWMDWLNWISIGVSFVLSLVLIAGGVQMARGRAWGLSLAAAVCAIVPCLAPRCALG